METGHLITNELFTFAEELSKKNIFQNKEVAEDGRSAVRKPIWQQSEESRHTVTVTLTTWA